MERNDALRWLTGKTGTPSSNWEENPDIEAAPVPVVAPLDLILEPEPAMVAPAFTTPITTQCTVVEGDTIRMFRITIEPPEWFPNLILIKPNAVL